LLEEHSDLKVLRLTNGANSAGACLAGMLPNRAAAGKAVANPGMDIQSALDARLKGYLLLGVEPGLDFANPHNARQSMLAAEFVVMLTPFENESMQDYANVILPVAPYAETSGTYINVDKTWQSVRGAQAPHAESRPAWKILRVIANLLHCKDFNYASTEEVLAELKTLTSLAGDLRYEPYYPESLPLSNKHLVRVGEWPLYRCDMIVRHAQSLQSCAAAESACIRIHPTTANRLKLDKVATVSQGDIEITLPLKHDERLAADVIWVATARPETQDLGHSFAAITIKR
jgi:NADH-quinone oxidoreductase subunit G